MSARSLRGMTWSHPRGYDPMVACAAAFEASTGIAVHWEKRSLQDFESYPVEELARRYDLIVIDHPHVGQITEEACLLPLDVLGREPEREAMSRASVGLSYPSYDWQGRQWAFPIDAATQVQAWRSDLMARPVQRWEEMLELARRGQVLLPLRPPHSLMCVYTLAANLGRPCQVKEGEDLIDPGAGIVAARLLREVSRHCSADAFGMDPIAVFEAMADDGSTIACSPLIYGYVSYAVEGFRPRRIDFADIPAAGSAGPVGSALGGTGIAVSAFSADPEAAIDFAYFVASGDVQRGLYARSGGQPGHAEAWADDAVNAAASDFYRNTRATLEGAWLRPRHDGYMGFQQRASEAVNDWLQSSRPEDELVGELNAMFRESFATKDR